MEQLVTFIFPYPWLILGFLICCLLVGGLLYSCSASSSQLIQGFMQHSVGVMLIYSVKEHRLLYANPYAAELLPLELKNRRWLFKNAAIQQQLEQLLENYHSQQGPASALWQMGENRFFQLKICRGHIRRRKVWFINAFDMSDQQHQLQQTQQHLQHLTNAFNSLPNFVFFKDSTDHLLGCNQAWAHFHGLQAKDVIGKSLADIFTRKELHKDSLQTQQVLSGHSLQSQEWVMMNDGQRHLLESHSYPLLDAAHKLQGVMNISTDVTSWHKLNQTLERENQQRIATEAQLKKQTSLIRSVFNASPDPIGFFDRRGVFVGGNEYFAAMFGLTQKQLQGQTLQDVLPKERSDWHIEQIARVMETGEPFSYEELVVLPDGQQVWYEIRKAPYQEDSSGERGVILVARDVTDRKHTQQQLADAIMQLEEMSFIDGLTGVANRRSFDERLSQLWAMHTREQSELALILIDVDCFKQYNDNYGHQKGDEALLQVARVIKRTARRSCDLVARYGGEEFAVLLPHTDLAGAQIIAQQLLENVRGLNIEHQYSEVKTYLTISLGVTCAIPVDGDDYGELIRAADINLYRAKSSSRDCYIADGLAKLASSEIFQKSRFQDL